MTLGIAALLRRLRRRGADASAPPVAPSDPADELRQKLAESRSDPAPAAEPASASDPEPEPPVAPPDSSVEARRADVHEQGRSAVDEMREADETS